MWLDVFFLLCWVVVTAMHWWRFALEREFVWLMSAVVVTHAAGATVYRVWKKRR